MPAGQLESLPIKGVGRVNCEERAKCCHEILLGLHQVHGLREKAKDDAEEFLHYLVANNSLVSRNGSPDQVFCESLFPGLSRLKSIDEDVCIDEKSIVHSF